MSLPRYVGVAVLIVAALLVGAVPRIQAADLLVPFVTDDSGGPGSVQRYRYEGKTGKSLGAFTTGGPLSGPVHVVFGPDGDLYVASINNGKVLRYDGRTGVFLDTFVDNIPHGEAFGFALGPLGLAFGPDGNLYVSNDFTNTVERYNGTTGASLGTFASAGLEVPTGLVFGPDCNLYVSSFNTSTVERYNRTTGTAMGTFAAGGGLDGPEQLVFGPDGNLYVSSFNSNEVLRYNGKTGVFERTFVTADSGGLNGPTGVTFGPDNNLYVSSNATNEVLRYNGRTGAFLSTFIAASGELEEPAFLTFTSVPRPQSQCHPHRTDDD